MVFFFRFLLLKSKIQSDVQRPVEAKKENEPRQTKTFGDSIFEVQNVPVMESVLDVLSIIGKHKEIAIIGKGESISNAVTVALIVTEKMLKGNSEIHKITVDSEPVRELGQVKSNIEIILKKI